MIIRQATISDAWNIAKVNVDAWRTTYKGIVSDDYLNELSYNNLEKRWMTFINDSSKGKINIFVSENEENEIIGFASCGIEREIDNPTYGELYAIYIIKEYQNKGVGKILFDCVIKKLNELKFNLMLIWALEDNLQACRFYELMGGEKVKEKYIKIGNNTLKEVAYEWIINS
ncbi:GNAT family N-acetyltransferase [Candidatus Clostridium radicumherbarum]|uniref:GNAT family N-acetyltransferase n=1 Tax=Candidatus Clostridium radicumherbarum TaxID=3381662 RepID=A0ABW8TRI8_9CLOT